MLNVPQLQRMFTKLSRLERTYAPYLFPAVQELDCAVFETEEDFFSIPEGPYRPIRPGERWGRVKSFGWFKMNASPDETLLGRALYLRPQLGGAEGMLYKNGEPNGIFTLQNGNHEVSCLTTAWDGRPIDIAIEMYAGHHVPGVSPFQNDPPPAVPYVFSGAQLCLRDELVLGFLFDLRVLRELAEALPETDYRKAEVANCLTEVYRAVLQSPEDCEETEWRASLQAARDIMAPCLKEQNAPGAPIAGMIGHSHMDTAWLWPTKVTLKKCARTYSNQLNLMEQYPEHRFFQSSAYHLEWIRRYYPSLFARLAEKIKEGRYEPNGGVWVECDCNIPSGESMVRQFLWGQRYTQKFFGYRSNCFWLPDTFGYNAAIPQIMKGCGVDYFVTTKMSWNDVTRFPWETFYWEGIDGTKVFTHLTNIESFPGPKSLIARFNETGTKTTVEEKRITNMRLLPYGHGDGGGGPTFEMLEAARRCADLNGCPKVQMTSAHRFLQELEQTAYDPPTHRGELYLELHRGTLTNQHVIKRNNRKAEQALHALELVEVLRAVGEQRPASGKAFLPLWETLLVNQFHDILPGTCLQEVHEEAERQVGGLLKQADALLRETLQAPEDGTFTVLNPLGFSRSDTLYLPCPVKGAVCQQTETMEGKPIWAVDGITLPAFGGVVVEQDHAPCNASASAFQWDGKTLVTPFARIALDAQGRIESFYDLRLGRELRDKTKLPLNTLLFGEDVPADWDNWDVDADLFWKLKPVEALTDQKVVSNGPVEFRLRNTYRLSEKSSLRQDLVFYASSPRVDFETVVDWQDHHRFLKAAFDLDLRADFARTEIQFGFTQRPTTRNTLREQAMFEVSNHRYTDLSELDQGAAVLNDCKYGVTVENGSILLSLHKGGCRPDPRGDTGVHRFTYAFFPHASGFGAAVVEEGQKLNASPIVSPGAWGGQKESLVTVDKANVALDTVKPCEDEERAFILRLYESTGTHTRATLSCRAAKEFLRCNLLEEPMGAAEKGQAYSLSLRPFEIVTLKITY